MDDFDLRMLRALGHDHVLGWGSLDPRLTAADVAKRLGVARSTVSARLKRWSDVGFLKGFHVLPHPALLDVQLGLSSVRVPDPTRRRRFLDDLHLMDGVFGALEHVGGWIGLGYVAESEAAAARRRRLVERQDGVEKSGPYAVWTPPPCTATLTPLDWRIVAALREAPLGALQDAAARVGVSTRTIHRRYHALARGRAVWLAPELDFVRWDGKPLVRLYVELAPGAPAAPVDARLQARWPLGSYVTGPPREPPPERAGAVDVMLPLPSVAALDDVLEEVGAWEDVARVDALWLRRSHWFPATFDERVAQRAEG